MPIWIHITVCSLIIKKTGRSLSRIVAGPSVQMAGSLACGVKRRRDRAKRKV